jgi:hypothetical protein
MLVDELMGITSKSSAANDADTFKYCKDIILDAARLKDGDETRKLSALNCWPCRLPSNRAALLAIGEFHVNDRQHLFDIFAKSQTFLDFNFDKSREISALLRKLGCTSFLSDTVTVKTEAHEPLQIDKMLTQNYRNRASALIKYVI